MQPVSEAELPRNEKRARELLVQHFVTVTQGGRNFIPTTPGDRHLGGGVSLKMFQGSTQFWFLQVKIAYKHIFYILRPAADVGRFVIYRFDRKKLALTKISPMKRDSSDEAFAKIVVQRFTGAGLPARGRASPSLATAKLDFDL